MDHRKLLGRSFDCNCGRSHTVPTEHLIYDQNAIDKLPDVAAEFIEGRDILVIADTWTMEVVRNASQTRERFTILDLAGLLGINPGEIDQLVQNWITS